MTWMGDRRALYVCLVLAGCGGPAAGTDAGPPPIDASLSTEAMAAVAPMVEALAVTTSMSAPLGDDGEMLRRDSSPDDATAQMRASDGFSGGSVVTPETCVAYTWTGLTAAMVMTDCTLEATGTPIAGTLSLAIELRPTTFTLAITDVTDGTSTYGGSITVHMNGTDLMAETAVDVMLDWDTPASTGQLAATDLVVEGEAAVGVSVSGDGSATIDGASMTLAATDVRWGPMECRPSSGTLLVTGGVFPLPTTITFLSTTPTDGIVRVEVGSFPAIDQALLEPCP